MKIPFEPTVKQYDGPSPSLPIRLEDDVRYQAGFWKGKYEELSMREYRRGEELKELKSELLGIVKSSILPAVINSMLQDKEKE